MNYFWHAAPTLTIFWMNFSLMYMKRWEGLFEWAFSLWQDIYRWNDMFVYVWNPCHSYILPFNLSCGRFMNLNHLYHADILIFIASFTEFSISASRLESIIDKDSSYCVVVLVGRCVRWCWSCMCEEGLHMTAGSERSRGKAGLRCLYQLPSCLTSSVWPGL